QQGEAEDHFRHDERRHQHKAEDEPAAKPAKAVHRKTGGGAENERDRRCHDRDFEAGERRVAVFLVLDERAVPARREPAPDRHEPRAVEGINDEQRDRQVQKREPEEERAEAKQAAAARDHAAASRSRKRSATRSGSINITTNAIAIAAAAGQSTLSKNSCHSILPTISVPGPPNRSGMTNSPTAGMKTSRQPAATPGSDKGRITSRNTRRGRAPRSAAASTRLSSRRDRLP